MSQRLERAIHCLQESIDKQETCFDTGLCVISDSIYCGQKITACFNSLDEKRLLIIDPLSKRIIELPLDLECGFCNDELFQEQCEIENISIQYCADVDTTHTPADIIALISASGETFNDSGIAIDITADDQKLVYASVQSYYCDSVVKKNDGSTFNVIADSACVNSMSGDVIQQLYQGGKYLMGDTQDGDLNNVVIDETVVWPCGSGGVYCFKVKRLINEQKIR